MNPLKPPFRASKKARHGAAAIHVMLKVALPRICNLELPCGHRRSSGRQEEEVDGEGCDLKWLLVEDAA